MATEPTTDTPDIRAVAADLARRLAAVPEAKRDEYEALLAAALDETGGDLPLAMALADELIAEDASA